MNTLERIEELMDTGMSEDDAMRIVDIENGGDGE